MGMSITVFEHDGHSPNNVFRIVMERWIKNAPFAVSYEYLTYSFSVITCSGDCTARAYDSKTGKVKRVFKGHESPINAAVVSKFATVETRIKEPRFFLGSLNRFLIKWLLF